jgi:hypothetical protein
VSIHDRNKRARVRSIAAAQTRLGKAQQQLAQVAESEALEGDEKFDMSVRSALLTNSERDLHGALALVADCNRSVSGVERSEDEVREERVLGYLAGLVGAARTVFNRSHEPGGVPWEKLEQAMIFPPDIEAAIEVRMEER